MNTVGRLYYSASTTLCCAHSLSEDGAAALGAQAGEARLATVFTKAGFSEFRKAKTTPFNLILKRRFRVTCRKLRHRLRPKRPRPTANRLGKLRALVDGAAIASKKLRRRIQKCLCGIKKLLAYKKEVNELFAKLQHLSAMPTVKIDPPGLLDRAAPELISAARRVLRVQASSNTHHKKTVRGD